MLFDQLQTFTRRYMASIDVDAHETPWQSDGAYDGGEPVGAVLHFTADNDIERVARWFMRKKYGARASANFIVADRKYPGAKAFAEGLPLVQALPVTILQCAPPEVITWHATWTNRQCLGIEALNVGELRIDGSGKICSHWRRDHDPDEPEWSMEWSNPIKQAVSGWGRYWEPYPIEQIRGIIELLRALVELYPQMDPSWIIGHEAVQSVNTLRGGLKPMGTDKRDPGPLFPIHAVRDSALGGNLEWLDDYSDSYSLHVQDETVRNYAMSQTAMMLEADEAWVEFREGLRDLSHGGRFGIVGKTALKMLGYHIPQPTDPDMRDVDKKAVYLFQRMSGLHADKIPGPKTRKAMIDRFKDRGVLG